MFAVLLSSFGLPWVATLLCSKSHLDHPAVLVVAKIIPSMMLPSLVTFAFHSDCLGAWVLFNQLCRQAHFTGVDSTLLRPGVHRPYEYYREASQKTSVERGVIVGQL
eukprot:3951709-Amphidinium_carterae.1